ncbi:YdaS family helix-turn-helix protein [Sphingomonadaceae bacterium G21617-S1]|nr:YdaS family helix-turn-helix protein [Sphingomonadaceae bacterium G21617-S1]
MCGVSQPTVWSWIKADRLPAEYVLLAERETGVSRHELRPDLYADRCPACAMAGAPATP